MKYKLSIISLAVLFIFVFGVSQALAGSATVSWNANTEPDLAGYKIYYGTSTRTGTDPKVCGMCGYSSVTSMINKPATSYTFSNLTNGQTYYFSVSAIDASNNESAFSAQVSKYISALTADLNSDTRVNIADAGILMSYWGSTARPTADINQDGNVNINDAGIMMSQWTG